ncbi:nucleotide pyrophosphohydrolase [Arthrobacter livingstonensis]|uniref:Nucleotide pyrophosphohydrolase n=1 Tax=Arthrobacter livingstonensis TaxID=670078 RepID=A0A2V5LXE6_9MICC|nr:MazG nucleotide pyrophosphohydrolase domain-containing protein [Arthrobacter livingstonensis]PYI68447.1 nucleotide pyrophosphohydrolase [Arthrobacter livingstonensis]
MTRTDPPEPSCGTAVGAAAAVERLAAVISELREHCLWTAALTHGSLITYLVEESYELADVVESPGALDVEALKGELGDILYQVMLHTRLQAEAGGFTLADVADHLREKLIRRNSHVFHPDGTLRDGFPDSIAEIERNYAAEKGRERSGSESVFDSLPASLPALALAAKTLERAEAADGHGERARRDQAAGGDLRAVGAGASLRAVGAGGDRDQDAVDPGDRTRRDPAAAANAPHSEDELGELLFDVVRAAQSRGLDAERALRSAVRHFQAAQTSAG